MKDDVQTRRDASTLSKTKKKFYQDPLYCNKRLTIILQGLSICFPIVTENESNVESPLYRSEMKH